VLDLRRRHDTYGQPATDPSPHGPDDRAVGLRSAGYKAHQFQREQTSDHDQRLRPAAPGHAGWSARGRLRRTGIEVNQVFASFTDASDDTYTIEVPAGEVGPFDLVLEGQADADYSVEIRGLANGQPVYTEALSGSVSTGERLVSSIDQRLQAGPTAAMPTTALVSGGRVMPLEPFEEALPGKILLSPSEIDSPTQD
jgi:hypothetical protein